MENKNKIDSVVDEVKNSKYVNKVFPYIASICIFFIVAPVAGDIGDSLTSPPWEGIIAIGSGIIASVFTFKLLKK